MTKRKIHFMTPELRPICGLTRVKNPTLTDAVRWTTCKLCLTIIERERRFGTLWIDQIKS